MQGDLSYKSHIDGLRALAITIGVMFHTNGDLFAGGYLGVNMFFVISGYVITQSLYKNYLQNGKINIIDFYLRRLKRLYPALVVVVLTTLVLYILFGVFHNFKVYMISGVSALFALSNLWFLQIGHDYFLQDLINPFLHTWSLAVEEQFYFIYPFLLLISFWFIKRTNFKINTIAYLIIIFSICCYAIFYFKRNTIIGDFYFPIARFWEFGMGCALFLLPFKSEKKNWINSLSYLGVFVILYLQFFHATVNNIYIETLLVDLSTALIIIGSQNLKITKFFQIPIVVYTGKLSYSIYLWHMPVIYFADLYLGKTMYYIAVPVLSYSLAMLSFHFIEGKFRHNNTLDKPFKFLIYSTPILFVGFFVLFKAVLGMQKTENLVRENLNNFEVRAKKINFPVLKRGDFYVNSTPYTKYYFLNNKLTNCHSERLDKEFYKKNCFKEEKSSANYFHIMGDSHAIQFVPMLNESKFIKNLMVSSIDRGFYVPNMIAVTKQLYAQKKFDAAIFTQKSLENNIELFKEQKKNYKNNFLILSVRYPFYVEQNVILNEKLEVISKADIYNQIYLNTKKLFKKIEDDTNIILIANIPQPEMTLTECVVKTFKNLENQCDYDKKLALDRRFEMLTIMKKLEKEFKNISIFDAFYSICSREKCEFFKNKNYAVIHDKSHITYQTSENLSNLFDEWLVNKFNYLN